MPNIPPVGARILGQQQGVQINTMQVLFPAGLMFRQGGCDLPGCVIRCEVVDLPRGTQYIVPIDIQFAEKLHKQLGELIAAHNKQALEG